MRRQAGFASLWDGRRRGLEVILRTQLQGNGQCWGATFSTAIKNDTGQFTAKSD